MFVAPFIETPYWCIESKEQGKTEGLTYNCEVVSENYVAGFSAIVNLGPIVSSALDIFCLAFFAYFRWFKSTWSVNSSHAKLRNIIFVVLCSISFVVFAFSAF